MQQRARIVESYGDLSVWPDRGRLPNGVFIEKWIHSDRFWGSQEALIEAGFAKPQWFPAAPTPGKNKGTIKSIFRFEDNGRSITLSRVKKSARPRANRWNLAIDVSEDEKARRQEEQRHQEAEQAKYSGPEASQDQGREAEAEEERNIAALKRRLPPFDEDLTEAEIEHLRVLRALSDRRWRVALEITENLLVMDAADGRLAQPLRSVSHLALVVDNDRAPQ